MTIFLEAEGESVDGKTMVGEVILTRTRRKFHSDGTIAGTVLAPYQFSCWNTKSARTRGALLDLDTMMGQECVLAWERAIAGSNLAHGAVFYLNRLAVLAMPEWASASHLVAHHGNHDFYVDRLPPEMTT
jgi:spore germination cell wall hydrolase CwlJ-like protein